MNQQNQLALSYLNWRDKIVTKSLDKTISELISKRIKYRNNGLVIEPPTYSITEIRNLIIDIIAPKPVVSTEVLYQYTQGLEK